MSHRVAARTARLSAFLKPLTGEAEIVEDSGGLMDFFDLAARMSAGLDGVRACLLLSDDGLTLASYPGGEEDRARQVWDRLAQIGEPHRGFLDLGDEVWAVVRRGPYTAVVVSTPTVRPGLLLDRIESHLRVAEETRLRESAGRPPGSKPELVRRPRTSLHRDNGREAAPREKSPTEPAAREKPASQPSPREKTADAPAPEPRQERPLEVIDLSSAAARAADAAAAGQEAEGVLAADPSAPELADGTEKPSEKPAKGGDIERNVDRVALAREFSKLISDARTEE